MVTTVVKIKGFNIKEQKIYQILCDGENHSIADMADAFKRQAENDAKAQSFARNGIRRLINDGWVEKAGRGTYTLTKEGRKWVRECKDTTASFGVKRGRKPGTTNKVVTDSTGQPVTKKKKVTKKKATKKQSTAKKKVTKKKAAFFRIGGRKSVAAEKTSSMKKAVKAPTKVRKAKNKAAKKKVGPLAAKDKAAQLAAELSSAD